MVMNGVEVAGHWPKLSVPRRLQHAFGLKTGLWLLTKEYAGDRCEPGARREVGRGDVQYGMDVDLKWQRVEALMHCWCWSPPWGAAR